MLLLLLVIILEQTSRTENRCRRRRGRNVTGHHCGTPRRYTTDAGHQRVRTRRGHYRHAQLGQLVGLELFQRQEFTFLFRHLQQMVVR